MKSMHKKNAKGSKENAGSFKVISFAELLTILFLLMEKPVV